MKRKGKLSQSSPEETYPASDESSFARENNTVNIRRPPSKKSRRTTTKSSESKAEEITPVHEWPDYFQTLYKIFKAINVVLAFVSSKRQLATSFSAVRTSVESIIKRPLEIGKVSEIKALLPDLLKFSYVPISDLTFDENSSKASRSISNSEAASSINSSQGHVLVLEFEDRSNVKRDPSGSVHSNAVKKIIEARNERFEMAVHEYAQRFYTALMFMQMIPSRLIIASSRHDDPVNLLIAAGRSFVPVNHSVGDDKDLKEMPTLRPSINQVISDIMASPWYKDQIIYRRLVEAKAAQTGYLNPPISDKITNAVLYSRNITTLYSHQVAAIDAIRRGKHVVVSTSTASGKSVIYQALAQDQKESLSQLLQICPGLEHVKVATYDGDTSQEDRTEIRDTASVIITNFDTLHASILPNEEKWRSFLKRLKLLAVDELHYYTGLLGSHVAYILRRFRRVCEAVGNKRIRLVSCSATLANPAEYMSKLFAIESASLEVISNDGAPSGSKEYILWNPPLIDEMDPSLGRRSSLSEASKLMRTLMKSGLRVILFCKIRKVCELVSEIVSLCRVVVKYDIQQAMKTLKADLSNEGRMDIVEKDRRQIEHEAFSGQLLGIIATNALELGIDIGALDAVIMLGFPMTISNFRQQAGRAGRRSQDSLAIMVADPFPIDQHFVNQPLGLFEDSLDDLIIDMENELILEAHLQCASYEMPIAKVDEKWFGSMCMSICKRKLLKDDDGWYHPDPKFLPFPSRHVAIRGTQEETYMVVDMTNSTSLNKLEEVEFSRALFELYEGGVFMHQGETFIVKEVSHDSKVAKVVRADVNYITSPRDVTRILPLQTFRALKFENTVVEFGSMFLSFYILGGLSSTLPGLNVCVKVFGFFKIRGSNILDAVELITPPWERETIGFWIDLPNVILERLYAEEIDGAAAIHAAEHAVLNQYALSQDVKTDCRVAKEGYADGNTSAKRAPRY
uniref:P-loop containing nucleoside triphosphate hydrolase protein n=2 Tax=Psilocybe cubensis TaxID=181762 RepID=A0A8H7Y073_PSICU